MKTCRDVHVQEQLCNAISAAYKSCTQQGGTFKDEPSGADVCFRFIKGGPARLPRWIHIITFAPIAFSLCFQLCNDKKGKLASIFSLQEFVIILSDCTLDDNNRAESTCCHCLIVLQEEQDGKIKLKREKKHHERKDNLEICFVLFFFFSPSPVRIKLLSLSGCKTHCSPCLTF